MREKKRPSPWKPPQTRSRRLGRKLGNVGLWLIVLGSVAAAALVGEIGPGYVGCDIKANISVRTGERIYHVPGQKYYSATRIDWLRGERWFCSEQAARDAGWRKARI